MPGKAFSGWSLVKGGMGEVAELLRARPTGVNSQSRIAPMFLMDVNWPEDTCCTK
jgi:hypothetical protein